MAGAPGLERGLDIIELIGAAPAPVRFNDIAQHLGVSHVSASRILRVLRDRGFVEKDAVSGRYKPGAKMTLVGLSIPVVERLRREAAVLLPALMECTRSTILVIHWTGAHMHCIAKQTHPESIAMQPLGEIRTNLLDCPWGWLFYQSLDDAKRRQCWRTGPSEYPDVTRDRVSKELAAFARSGYVRHGQGQLCRLAAPIRQADGALVGALVMGCTAFALSDAAEAEFGRLLIDYACRLSAALG